MSNSDGHALTPDAAASARERVLRAAQFVSQQRCQQETVCDAVCCSVLQCVSEHCSVLQRVLRAAQFVSQQ